MEEKNMKINMRLKRFLCLMLALVMVCTGFTITPKKVNAAVTNASASAAASYGLMEDVQDGVILHCWDWSFDNIKEQIPAIAAAGYTAIQTSPIQEAKESTKGKTNDSWWVFYQPKSFKIDNQGTSALGTKAEFIAMCDEAHKYGIKVIVDVVANHLGNQTSYNVSNAVAADIKNDSTCWHTEGFQEISDYSNRYRVTHYSMGGLPDLNTESSKIQGYVLGFLKECIDAGADGFRFDAAKHISVKAEGSEYTFWENTSEKAKEYAKSSRGIDLYVYGEILDGTAGPAISSYTTYMSITDNQTGNSIRNAVASGNAGAAASSYYQKGAPADKVVLWAESHDTYSNENKESTGVSAVNINKTWAMVASRANATSLYFARTNGYRAGTIGTIGTYDWKNKEVAEVNKFHNFFHGETEYLASSGNIAYNERGTSGVVLVNCSGTSTSVNVKANKMADGTYKDQITGNTFTVSNGYIKGNIGSTGIAVVYNAQKEPKATISMEGGSFDTKVLYLTLGLKNATSGTYKIGNTTATKYTSTTTISIGTDMEIGESVSVTLTATDGSKTTTSTYTFTKEKGFEAPYEYGVYFKNTQNWSRVNAYYWSEDDTTLSTWPGVAMTHLGNGIYGISLSKDFEGENIIFNNSLNAASGGDQTADLEFVMNGIYTVDGLEKVAGEEPEVLIPPNKVTGFAFSGRTYNTITLKWNKSTDAEGYYIEKYTNDGWIKVADIGNNTTTSYKVTGLGSSVNYKFKITAYNELDGNMAHCEASTVTVKTLPSAVRDFSFSARRYNYITLKWSANSSAAGYQIQQYKNGAWTTIKTVTGKNTTSYKVTGLKASTTYKFRIRAYNSDSSKTLYGSFVEKSIKTLPSNIARFSFKARTDKFITLRWDKNTSADGYVIQQYKSGAWTTIKTIEGNATTSYKVTGLKASTTYNFRIRGYKLDGTKKLYGSYVSAKIKSLPSVVKGFKVASRGKYSVKLKWNKNTSATGYVIEQYKGGKWVEVKRITKQSTTSCKIEGLKKGTSYKFRIKAYKASADKTKKWYGKTSAIAVKTLSK